MRASEWTTTVGEICDRFGGSVQTGPFGSQLHASDYADDGIPVVMPQDIQGGMISRDRIARVGSKHVSRLTQHVLRIGDVVFSRRGDVSRFAVVSEAEEGWLCGTGSIRIRLNSPDIHVGYLRHYLRQEMVGEWLKHHAKGVTMPNLNTSVIRALPFVYPPLSEQQRIAEILDKTDALRTKRRAAVATLDSLKQSIFVDMFGDPVTDFVACPRVALVDLCGQADDVRCGPFGTQLAQSEYTTEGVPLWGIKSVNALFRAPTEEFLEPSTATRLNRYSLEPGDIVMTRKGTVGNCAVYPADQPPGIMHSDLLRVRVDRERAEPTFVAHQLHYSRDVERQIALISGGAIMPGINVTKLKTIKLAVPSVSLQRCFADRVAAVDQLRARYSIAVEETDALFASLQHRAFNGELFS